MLAGYWRKKIKVFLSRFFNVCSYSLVSKVGAVCVTMFSKDAATVMTFTPYFEGSAPLRIDNDSSFEMSYRQV